MSDHTAEGPRAILIPGDNGYFHAEELSDLGVVVFTQRLPYVDVEGHGRMPAMHPTVNVLGDAGKAVLYYRVIRGDDSDAALDTRLQEVIDRLRVGTIRHDGTHLDIEDVAVEVYRYMEERLASYEQHNDITDDSLDDPESWPYNTLVATLRSDAYDAYDLWDEEEDNADEDRPARVADRLTAVGVDWALLAVPPTTDWIVRELAHDIVSRWEERRTAFVEGHRPSAMAPHKRERFVLTLAMEEMEARGPGTTVDDVMPTVEAKIRDLEALRRRREME